jgi:biotin carboxyl carrier protein
MNKLGSVYEDGGFEMKYVVTINKKKYEVEVEKGQATIVNTTDVAVSEIVSHTVQAAAPAQTSTAASAGVATQASPAGQDAGGEVVKAPIPGTLLDVKTSQGAKVKKGQVIFILEAMKMENEIMAPVDGTIAQIKAAKGSSVSTGDILAVIQS